MSLKRLADRLKRSMQSTAIVEGKPSKNRVNQAGSEIRKGGRASADIFHATDVALDVSISLADMRKLIKGQDVEIEARDKKKLANQSNVYTLTLRYKGKEVPTNE